MEVNYLKLLLLTFYVSLFTAAPQTSEINSTKADTTNSTQTTVSKVTNITIKNEVTRKDTNEIAKQKPEVAVKKEPTINETEKNVMTKIYTIVSTPFKTFVSSPKVNYVLRNIGTCIVNGAMELITHYLPAPLIPLIASAAGLIIPFEPVVMLRDRMPVTTYRRAFKTAVKSFLGTFDQYKNEDNFDDDPYMLLRFNRRFMNNNEELKNKQD